MLQDRSSSTRQKCKRRSGVDFVPILRAWPGMLDPAMAIVPRSSVGYIGLERNEETAEASGYYSKMPDSSDFRMSLSYT